MVRKVYVILMLCLMALPAMGAESDLFKGLPSDPALRRWIRENDAKNRDDKQELKIRATYYSNEYVEALINAEAEKNLWTQDEVENYRYTLFSTLNLHDAIVFHIDMYVQGIPMYAQPFDKHIYLMIGKKRYTPSDYDKRFNFKISGARDGTVSFPRYDEKTGKDLLAGVKDIRLIFDGSVSSALSGRDLVWIWDITKDKGAVTQGRAANRLEIDRLLKRMEKLRGERADLQGKLDAVNAEFNQVNSRIEELQAQ